MTHLFNRFLFVGALLLSLFYVAVVFTNHHDAALKKKQDIREAQRQEMIASEYGYIH